MAAYIKGRNDVLIAEFRQYQANMLALSEWNTNRPPELREFVKAHYYHLANQIPKNWVGAPRDYGPVSTNVIDLTGFKGPMSAQEEHRRFRERFAESVRKPNGE